MKKLSHFITTKTNAVLIGLLIVFSQTTFGQGTNLCDYTVKVDVKHSDCNKNGEITVTLDGPDIENMPNKMYHIYLKGTTPTDKPVTNNTKISLAPGLYTVQTFAHCISGPEEYSVDKTIDDVEVKQILPWEQAKFQVKSTRKSMSCSPTGAIRMEAIAASAKGPFLITVEQGPAEYLDPSDPNKSQYPVTILSQTTNYLASELDFEGFPAGQYLIKLVDGCGGVDSNWATVEQLSSDFYSNMIYPYVTTPKYQSSTNPTDKHLLFLRYLSSNPGTTSEFYDYYINWEKYYEYAYVLPSENATTLPENRWNDLVAGNYMPLYESDKTLAEIRENKALYVPRVALRVKNSTCATPPIQVWTPTMYNPILSVTTNNADCDNKSLSFVLSSNVYYYYRVIAYPYAWQVTNRDNGQVLASSSVTDSVSSYSTSVSPNLTLGPGNYAVTITDRQGYPVSSNFTVTTIPNSITSSTSAKTLPAPTCTQYDSIYPYIYGSGGTAVSGATITFRRDLTDSRVPSPPQTTFVVPKTYTGNIYPYNQDPTNTTTAARKYLHHANEYPYGTSMYFDITDSCGTTKTMAISQTSTYIHREFYYDEEPIISAPVDCGWANVSISNMANLLKYKYYSRGFDEPYDYTTTAYVRIKPESIPEGGQVSYSGTTDYISSSSEKIFLSKTGKYILQISRTTTFSTSYCLKEIEIDVDVPYFMMDEDKSAAYRCPNNSESGYIHVIPVNGSGDYLFELFNKNNLSTPIDSNDSGIFENWASTTSDDTLVVKVSDLVCLREFTQKIGIYDLNNATIAWMEGSSRKCVGDRLRLHALPLGENADYEWTILNTGEKFYVQHPEVDLTLDQSGEIDLKVTIDGCTGDNYVQCNLKISVADRLMYWNPEATDNNWHKKENWLIIEGSEVKVANAIPAGCTTVHIASNAVYYPNLDKDATPRTVDGEFVGAPACDTIIYHYGSETAYPHYLKYNRAKVQYNFGYYLLPSPTPGSQPLFNRETSYPTLKTGSPTITQPRMARARWYMLAGPLKNITGGDFGLGGYPHMYQRLFNAVSPMSWYAYHDNFTRAYHNLSHKMEETNNAIAILAPDFYNAAGWNNHKNMEGLYGIVEVPFYVENNSKVMAYHMQTYDEVTETSSFQYYNFDTFQPENKWEYLKRDTTGYRFVFENHLDTVSTAIDRSGQKVAMYDMPLQIPIGGQTNRVMIGNPLMCHIDFDKLYDYNSTVIKDNYWIVDADEVFYSYRNVPGETYDNTITKDIPPLQGFIVELLPEATRERNYLTFPLEGDYAVVSAQTTALPKPRTSPELRNSSDLKGWISIYGTTPPIDNFDDVQRDSIRIRSTVLFNYDLDNVPKLVLPEGMDNKAETFIIASDGSINTEQVENELPAVVKLGIESEYKKDVMLEVKVGGNIIEKALLFDKVKEIYVDVTNGGYYKFQHRYDLVTGTFKGLDSDRFELALTYRSGNDINSNSTYLSINANQRRLAIMSTETISDVELVNTQGSTLFYTTDIDNNSYERPLDVIPGLYIVKVTFKNGHLETRKIIVQ